MSLCFLCTKEKKVNELKVAAKKQNFLVALSLYKKRCKIIYDFEVLDHQYSFPTYQVREIDEELASFGFTVDTIRKYSFEVKEQLSKRGIKCQKTK